jgi:uncharacterized membrane protein YgcG
VTNQLDFYFSDSNYPKKYKMKQEDQTTSKSNNNNAPKPVITKQEDQTTSKSNNNNAPKPVLTEEELLKKVTNQLDFYFSDSNYPKDTFILDYANKDDGWVPVDVFLKFNKIKTLTMDLQIIEKCFKNAGEVVVSEDGKKVKRKSPLLDPEVLMNRTIYASGFSTGKYTNKLMIGEAFSTFGKVNSVWNLKDRNKKRRGVYIEYETEENASKALAAGNLNFKDEDKEYAIRIISKKTHLAEDAEKETKNEKFNKKKNNKRKYDDMDKEGGGKTSGLTPSVLVRVKNFKEIIVPEENIKDTRVFLKTALSEHGKIGYIDIDADKDVCIVRFNEAESAKNALKALNEDKIKIRDKELVASLLEGDEEKKYWDENILNSKSDGFHKKGRGRGGRGRGGRGRGRGGRGGGRGRSDD